MPEDPVDAAIAATEAPQSIALVQRQVTISSTGRPVMLAYPPDLSDVELFELVGWLAVGLRGELAAQRVKHDPRARLWTPGAPVVPRSS